MQFVEPEDLQRYGIIPELVGRLPVSVHLDELDEEALVRILKEPRNALVKQYEKMFELDGIGLIFDPGCDSGNRQQSSRSKHRCPWPALDHRIGHARHHVRASVPE